MLFKTSLKPTIILTAVILILLGISGTLNHKYQTPQFTVAKQDSAMNFSNNFLRIINIGNKRLIGATLWVQTLIESDTDHYRSDKLNNWLYLRFDSIITLDPKFLQVYQYGGQYLSIVKDDIAAASNIYKRGLKEFPDDYFLNFNAGFHYFYEAGDAEQAYPLFHRIQYHPNAPNYLPSLVAKLKVQQGDLEAAYMLMIEAYNRAPEKTHIKKKFQLSLYAIRAELDLDCLNQQRESCRLKDFDGDQYLANSMGQYYAAKPWKKFRIRLKPSKRQKQD